MCHYFRGKINGVELAKQLYETRYTMLYLFTSIKFGKDDVPSYLTVIAKGDMKNFDKLICSKKAALELVWHSVS